MGTPIRLAHIDDHVAMRRGLEAILSDQPGFDLVVSSDGVDEVLAFIEPLDLVVLDIRLADGSEVADNIARLNAAGFPVLCLTAAEDPRGVRAAAAAGSLGVVRKSDSVDVLLDALERAAGGEPVATIDWAAAIDGDPRLAHARLSPKEQEVLALYASGEKSVSVASNAGLSEKTVAEYVRRIRAKYAAVGRPAASRVDLYKRAVEDGFLAAPGHLDG